MIIQKEKYNFITKLIIAILALGFFYYSYRYVFQYNSESTSQSYRNTPTWLKLLKYPVMLLIYCYALVKFKWDKINWSEKTKVMLLLSTSPVIMTFMDTSNSFCIKHWGNLLPFIFGTKL